MRAGRCGIVTGCALPGLVATFYSSRQGAVTAVTSLWAGFGAAVITWLVSAQNLTGELSLTSVGSTDACLYGCAAGIGIAAIVTLAGSLAFPAHYDWHSLGAIRLTDEDGQSKDISQEAAYEEIHLRKAARFARAVTAFLFVGIFLIWPLSMYGSGYIFSRKFFTGWVIVSVLWAFFSLGAVTLFPVFEGRHTLWNVLRSAVGKGDRPKQGGGDDVVGGQDRKAESVEEEKKDEAEWVAEDGPVRL